MVSDHTAFCHFVARLHRCRCLWRRRQRRRRCRGLHRPRRGLRPWRHPRHPGPRHGVAEPPSFGCRYFRTGVVVLGLRGVLRHGVGLEVTTGEGVGVTSGASRDRGYKGQRQSQSEPDAEQSPCAFHMCSSVPSNGFPFRWIHPAPSIRYSTLITRGKKCQRKKGLYLPERSHNIIITVIVTVYNAEKKRWLMNGKRYSRQRELIHEALRADRTAPHGGDDLSVAEAANPSLSLGTVYRNLNLLADEGNPPDGISGGAL